jgi:hypothetical protein
MAEDHVLRVQVARHEPDTGKGAGKPLRRLVCPEVPQDSTLFAVGSLGRRRAHPEMNLLGWPVLALNGLSPAVGVDLTDPRCSLMGRR